jgi:hypothetical protein
MRHILLARGVLALGLPAFALSMSATPAFAAQRNQDDHDNHHSDTVKVTVCKKVVRDRYDNKDKARDDRNRRPSFEITVKTDKDYKTFYLKDGECDYAKLDFRRPRLTVSEQEEDGYKLKDIRAWGDVDDVYFDSRRDEAKIRFDDSGRYDPKVNVQVINKKDRRDDNHDHH